MSREGAEATQEKVNQLKVSSGSGRPSPAGLSVPATTPLSCGTPNVDSRCTTHRQSGPDPKKTSECSSSNIACATILGETWISSSLKHVSMMSSNKIQVRYFFRSSQACDPCCPESIITCASVGYTLPLAVAVVVLSPSTQVCKKKQRTDPMPQASLLPPSKTLIIAIQRHPMHHSNKTNPRRTRRCVLHRGGTVQGHSQNQNGCAALPRFSRGISLNTRLPERCTEKVGLLFRVEPTAFLP